MKVQRIKNSKGISWIVLDNSYKPVEPIQSYLHYLRSLNRSPNTIHAYACHLKLYWEFLNVAGLDWQQVSLENLADFIHWLRQPDQKVLSISSNTPKRIDSTINTILAAVSGFYDYQGRLGNSQITLYVQRHNLHRKYLPFLHHISKGKPTSNRILKVKETKKELKVLTQEQIRELVNACKHIRDKFLLCLLQETGMRIGQAIGLRHCDIQSWDNVIEIVPRDDNANGARAKTNERYKVHVSKELMGLYSQYFIDEYPEDMDSDYVFINIWEGRIGEPITYSTVYSLFRNLSKKTGIKVTPHLFRHTHATELIRQGWDMTHVQKRLGHSNIQTTINTYTHLDDQDMKEAFQAYINAVE